MNLGMPEMIFIFLLALVIFGPRKLPEIGRQLGKAMADFKRASNDFKVQIEDEIRQIEYIEEQKKAVQSAETVEGENAAPPAPEGTIAHDNGIYLSDPHDTGETGTVGETGVAADLRDARAADAALPEARPADPLSAGNDV